MTVYVDADACPVTRIAERIAKDHDIPVILLCDTNHQLTSDVITSDSVILDNCKSWINLTPKCLEKYGGHALKVWQE